MKRLAIIAVFGAAFAAHAGATVVTFDSLSGDGTLTGNYAGINWEDNWNYYSDSQDPYNPESPPERIYPSYPPANPTFEFDSPSVFNGAYFAGYDESGVYFQLYNGVSLVWTSSSLAPSATPTWLASGYGGLVTSVVVGGDQISNSPYYVMDNVTYNASSVPGPATALPMLCGLISLARKRRK